MLENQSLLADVGVPHEDRGGPITPPRCMEGFWKKFQMTHFDMPINVTTVKYALKSVTGLADIRVPHGLPQASTLMFGGGHEKVSND